MIPPATEWPQHLNTKNSGATLYWKEGNHLFNDTESAFKNNCAVHETRIKLAKLGWLTRTIPYSYNSQGFRSIDFDTNTVAGMAFGCSFTEGAGLLVNDVWPSVVSKQLNVPVYNLGIGGASMDTIFRMADYWIPILKPKFVLVACTFDSRVELCDYNGNFYNYFAHSKSNATFYKEWIQHDNNSKLNYKKNLLAVTAICSQYQIPLVTLPLIGNMPFDKGARDLVHSGPEAQAKFAHIMIQKLQGTL